MKYKIEAVAKSDYPEVVDVWEASVRATHYFLKEEDIAFFKPLILNEFLDAVDLRCVRDDRRKILGFLGVAEQKVEMLFIHPENRGTGIGKALLQYALDVLKVKKVDVNEANTQAVDFYQHLGFRTVARSALDASGKPYPILHMELA